MSSPSIQLSSSGQFQQIAYTQAQRMLACASLKAHALSEEQERKPIDLCVVLDRSGSMGGAKLELCLATLEFLLEQLGPKDRLSCVTFDTQVQTNWALRRMDAAGKAHCSAAIRQIQAGSMTNLSGGLLAGIEELKKGMSTGFMSRNSGGNEVKSVMLLTDGLANHGVTDSAGIVGLLRSALDAPGMGQCSVATFGYGQDHNEEMLRQISDAGRGVYYFVDEIDDVPTAFADCLGGLLSVVGQNIALRVGVPPHAAAAGATIAKVHTKRPVKEVVPGKLYEVAVGDMFAEEERDVLVELSLPALSAPVPAGDTQAEAVLQLNTRYCDVIAGTMRGRELPGEPVPVVDLPSAAADPATTAGSDEGEAQADVEADGMVLVATATAGAAAPPPTPPALTAEQAAAAAARAEGTESVVRVGRPPANAACALDEAANVSVHVTRQWARIVSAGAMDEARRQGQAGRYGEGTKALDAALAEVERAQRQVKHCSGGGSGSSGSGAKTQKWFGSSAGAGAGAGGKDGKDGKDGKEEDDALLSNLAEQLRECRADVARSATNRQHWESKAKYSMCNYAQSHHTQRSNCSKMGPSKSAYRGRSKQAMCSASMASASVMSAKSARSAPQPSSYSTGGRSSGSNRGSRSGFGSALRRFSRGPPPPPQPQPGMQPAMQQMQPAMQQMQVPMMEGPSQVAVPMGGPPQMPPQLMQPQMQQMQMQQMQMQQMQVPQMPQMQQMQMQQQQQQPASNGNSGMLSTIMESVRASWGASSSSRHPSQHSPRSPRPSA